MDFTLNSTEISIQKLAADFNAREIEPRAEAIDREGRLPDDLIGKYAKAGLLGLTWSEKYGGLGLGNLACALAVEQLAKSGCGAWWIVGFNNSIPESIFRFGSEELKARYLPALADGSAYASIQFTEEQTGSDPAALMTRSKPDGDSYLIKGTKRFSTFGAREGYAVTYTRDEQEGCTAFIIKKNTDRYSVSKNWELSGSGGVEASDVFLDDFRVPASDMLGPKGKAFDILLYWIATEKIQQCAVAVGIAGAALEEAIKYTNARLSRGKPISGMQGIRWMLADMKAKLEAIRWVTYHAAAEQDRDARDWQTQAAAAKLFVSPTAMEIVEMARRLHGAYGYTREYKIDRLARAVAGSSSLATSLEINRSIVGSSLVK